MQFCYYLAVRIRDFSFNVSASISDILNILSSRYISRKEARRCEKNHVSSRVIRTLERTDEVASDILGMYGQNYIRKNMPDKCNSPVKTNGTTRFLRISHRKIRSCMGHHKAKYLH